MAGSASRAGKYSLPSFAGPRAEQLAFLQCPQICALGMGRGVLDLDGHRRDLHSHRVVVVGRLSCRFAFAEFEVSDVGDGADRFVGPVHVHPRAGADRVGVARIHRVQQRGVGAVQFDQCPGERVVQRLALQRLGLPCPGRHRAGGRHRYHLAQWRIGDRVVLGRGHKYAAVGSAHSEDAAIAQRGEEFAERGTDRTGVVEGQRQRRRERWLRVIDQGRAT